jgi:hypothetical protein
MRKTWKINDDILVVADSEDYENNKKSEGA